MSCRVLTLILQWLGDRALPLAALTWRCSRHCTGEPLYHIWPVGAISLTLLVSCPVTMTLSWHCTIDSISLHDIVCKLNCCQRIVERCGFLNSGVSYRIIWPLRNDVVHLPPPTPPYAYIYSHISESTDFEFGKLIKFLKYFAVFCSGQSAKVS